MKIIKSFNILKKEINYCSNIGFVPTMGSLHQGHVSLIKLAKKKNKKVLVSIFVNPTQFNEKKDFIKYPRNLKKDIALLKKLKINYLFLPNENEIYKKGIKKKLIIFKKDMILCARNRIGHFQGVLAIINRFLVNINAKHIYFGEKDYQQAFLIKKYLQNKFSTKIITCKTIRNNKRLALSSRNNLLSKKQLKNSEKISKLLFELRNKILKKFNDIKLLNFYRSKINKLCSNIEYFEIRNSKNLSTKISKNNFRIFIAYKQDEVRLIDNL